MLTSGMCMNADALDPTTDLTASQLGSTSSSNHVLTNEATYCSPDDDTCKACSAQQDIGTGLCRGETNCVCWMICDSPTWEASAQLLLPGAIEAQDEQNESSCVLEVTSLSTPTPTIQTTIDTEASDNVCMWKQLGLEGTCGRPRTCMECLNDQLADGTDCTITSAGYCTTMDAYVYEEDYRSNTSASAPHYFPSTNTTYCDVLLDGTCSACIKERFNKSATGEIDPSQYCVGTDGCVCVGFCESAAYQQSAIDKFCESSDVASVDVFGVSFRSIGAIVVLCVAVPIVLIVTWSQRLRNAARARAIAFRNRPPANGPILGLAGWKKYREDLIAKEQKALEGVGGNEEVQIADGGRPYPIANPQIASISLEFQDPFEADRLSSASELSSNHEEDEEAATTNTSRGEIVLQKSRKHFLEDYEATQNDEDSGDRGVTFFVAGDAPYCETNSSSASSDGCVSIDSCASSTWWSEARERLPLIMRIVNESTPDCSFATDSVNADTSASDLDATAEATSTSSTTGNKNPLASDDKCTWLSAPPLELPAWKAMREELIAHGNGEHSVVGDRDRLTPLHAYNMAARQYGDRVSSEAVISIEARENDPVAASAASWRVWNRLP
ncbi:hypothetical protein BBJ28_00008387 [Nothophytophthora sp. Chile5]|nr:hypothetical protein BBJ28_00008387 [Nothophytophthora sp. Chile5]